MKIECQLLLACIFHTENKHRKNISQKFYQVLKMPQNDKKRLHVYLEMIMMIA